MYNKQLHIHFIGIGGIGMSGIATVLAQQGYSISGCDTDITQKSVRNLQKMNCIIHEGNNTAACADESIDIVVYSSAIRHDAPELVAARARTIPTIPRALMLAELMRTKYSIAVAGSHGKTTTTSMLSHIVLSAGLDPTVIIGGHLKTISHNAQHGNGDFLIAEADESDRSLLHLHATFALITNIDLEHLETYRDIDDITQTFKQFLNNIPFYGKACVCIDDPRIRSLLPLPHLRITTYGFSEDAETRASDVQCNADHSLFTVMNKTGTTIGTVRLNMPGKHNIQNALGAIALAQELAIPFEQIADALATFPGVERRFSYHGTYKGAELFDDYGHHPLEIANTLAVAHKRTKNKLTVIFQPHRFTRTHRLWDAFVHTFLTSAIDRLIITDIYPASEDAIAGVSSNRLVDEIKAHNPRFSVEYVPYTADMSSIKTSVDRVAEENDLILLLGAGKIHTVLKDLL